MFSSIKLNKTYSSEGTGPESLESDLTKLYFIDISRITPPKRKPFTRTVRSPHLPCSDRAFKVLTTHQKNNQQLFILGFFLPPVIPWLVCIVITIGKYKSTVKVTKDDQYWAFLCLFALAVYLLLAVAILMCLAVEFRWFGKIAAWNSSRGTPLIFFSNFTLNLLHTCSYPYSKLEYMYEAPKV